jgi:hypothetical protein
MVRTVEATRRMEGNRRSRHMTLWRSLKARQPPESPRERYGPGDALPGPSSLSAPALKPGRPFSVSKEHKAQEATPRRTEKLRLRRSEMSLLSPVEFGTKAAHPTSKIPVNSRRCCFTSACDAPGATSLHQIADALNARGIRMPRGGQWYAKSVSNLLARRELYRRETA